MIFIEPALDYGNLRIDRFTYSNKGKSRVMYAAIDNSANALIEAFDTLDQAIEYAKTEIMQQWAMAGSLPQEVQDEQNEIAKELLVWFTANVRWIAAHEGEQGIERFRQEIKNEIKNT